MRRWRTILTVRLLLMRIITGWSEEDIMILRAQRPGTNIKYWGRWQYIDWWAARLWLGMTMIIMLEVSIKAAVLAYLLCLACGWRISAGGLWIFLKPPELGTKITGGFRHEFGWGAPMQF